MHRFSTFLLLPALFFLCIAGDTVPPGSTTTTVAPVIGNNTGNETQPKVKPEVDIHKADYFNLTDWIQDYPNEEAELQQWKLHLVGESNKLLTQVTRNRKIRNEMTVANYEQLEDTPIQIEMMEKIQVNKHQMIYHNNNVRHNIFKHYKDKNLYYSFEVFYEDMPTAQIFVEPENVTVDFYDWGTVYNQTTIGNITIIQKYQIYLRKWFKPEHAYITPNSVFIKEYTYNITLKEVCVERGYYYKWTECSIEVADVKDAQVLHFLNTGRLHKCLCNCGFTDVVAPVFQAYERPPTTTTTQKPTEATQTTSAMTTTLAPAQSSTGANQNYQETTATGNQVTTTQAPTTSTTTAAPTTTTEDPVLKGKEFKAEIWTSYVHKYNGDFDKYGTAYHFTITLDSTSGVEVENKKHSPIDLETLAMEPAHVRQVKFNPNVEIDHESVNELHGNAHAAIGFSKTTDPMFMVDFEGGNATLNYHAVEIYLNVTEAKDGSLYQGKYKYHVEMFKVAILDHVSPSTTKTQNGTVLIAKLSFFSNCENNKCEGQTTTAEFFTNVGISEETSLTIQSFIFIGVLALLAVIAFVGFIYFCCARRNKKGPSRPPSVQFNGEGVHLVNNLENPNFEDGNPALDVVNPVQNLENPAHVVENPVNNAELVVPDDDAPIYGLLNPIYGGDSPA